jgi:allophanate hydrolase subunit 2
MILKPQRVAAGEILDLPKLARAWPGTAVSFHEVTWEEAQALKRQHELDFKRLRTGLNLLK